jgi:formylglycine-generating enzyme required for sulfatase activity
LGAGGVPIDGNAIVRNSGATWVLPTENEWYKAAYYNPASSSYFLFPTSNNNVPTAEPPPGGSNSANWNAIGGLTAVGAYLLSPSPYGTFDQAGNVMEWNETLIDSLDRGVRGGAFGSMTFGYDLSSHARSGTPATTTQLNLGFRVAMIPEPSTGLLASLGGLALLVCRRCRH